MSAGIGYDAPPSSGGVTLPIAESDVTNLTTDLAAKAPLASPTFTGTVTLPSGLVLPANVSIPTSATAVTQSATDSSTKVATTAHVQSNLMRAPGLRNANDMLAPFAGLSPAAVTTALLPTFYPIMTDAPRTTLSQLGVHVGASVAASTAGVAIYTITYSSPGTFSASLVYQLNAAIATTSTNIRSASGTTGAVGSGATTYSLDLTANDYIVGVMASTVTTLTLRGVAPNNGLGCLTFTGAGNGVARSSTTDWPASFDQTYAGALGSARIHWAALLTATGANWL